MNTGVRFDTLMGNKGNADTRGNQIQCGMCGIYCADNCFIGRRTGGPLLETFSEIIVKNHLRFLHHIFSLNIVVICQRMG